MLVLGGGKVGVLDAVGAAGIRDGASTIDPRDNRNAVGRKTGDFNT